MHAEALLEANEEKEIPVWDGQGDKVLWNGKVLSLGDFLMSLSKIKELWEILEKYPSFTEAVKDHAFWSLIMRAKDLVDYVAALKNEPAYRESLNICLNLVNLDKTQDAEYTEEAKAKLQKLQDLLHLDEVFKASETHDEEKKNEMCMC